MGCVNTKLVPEVPSDGHLVTTVYAAEPERQRNNQQKFKVVINSKYSGYTSQYDQKLPATCKRRQPCLVDDKSCVLESNGNIASTMSAEVQRMPGGKKVAKYRAKFDPRVTAKYDIKALIGRGSFSRVVRVEHKITKQPYAIKMINRIQGKEVFESELNVLRRVHHAYIIQLIEVFESKDKVYMVMELATGGELFDRIISKGNFTEKDANRVLRMVLDGVRYLHSLGIAHRDLKPENLLYYHPGHDSKILITDFGLSASIKASEGYMKTICGTPEYIAPEILARQPYTYQVDLWAVGVITYILLSGTMPFDDDNRSRLYRMILKAKYSYVGDVSITGLNY